MKPKAPLSLDLDNLWAYLKVKKDERWKKFPSYFDIFVPKILKILNELNIKITFFVVGQDAIREKEIIAQIAEAGHEIGNHSFHHEPCLSIYSRQEIIGELSRTEEAIYEACGKKPIGFRGPGFSWSPLLLQILSEKGYFYDSTLFPSFIGPLARIYYSWKTGVKGEIKKDLYGSFKDCFRSLHPYKWKLEGEKELIELPVTTIPILRAPFHMTYLMFLYQLSPALMRAYLKAALTTCRMTCVAPNFLLHPTDLLTVDELNFFPGMKIPPEEKEDTFIDVLRTLQNKFDLLPLNQFLETITTIKKVSP